MNKQTKPNATKAAQVKVKGRGFNMNPGTRVVPHRHLDKRRLSTREILRDL